MLKKPISIIISAILLILFTSVSIFALANDGANTDNSALEAALSRVESYNEEDYTPESYGNLYSLYETYSETYESFTTQEEIDSATAQILEAISDLMAYLNLNVSANNENAQIGVSFGETSGGAGKYTVVYSTPVTLTASEINGCTFAGWFETVSNRMLSTDRTYTFNMAVNTSLKATYYSNSKSVLTFKSCSGQIISVTEKTCEEWAQYDSLEDFIPASTPYRYGFTNGRWNVDNNALESLVSGQNVIVTPTYDSANAAEFAAPQTTDAVNLKLYYRFDSDKNVGSFVMKTAVPQNITPEAVGMLFVYKKAATFDPTAFDVNINNRQIVSQFDDFSDNTYITNMNKMTGKYNYAVKGYYVYNNGEKLVTVYSNQVNVINRCDVHNMFDVEAVAPTCTESGNTAGTYCDICGEYFGVEEIESLGHDYQSQVTAPTCTEQGYTTYTCSRCGDSYVTDFVNATGHTSSAPVEENRVEPTCTQTGSYDSVVYCSVCDAEISRTPQTINALGHSFTNYVSDGNATCTADGTKTATCDRCDATDTIADEGSALGHDYQSQVTAPTCTEQGYTTYTCSRCEDSYVTDFVNATGHTSSAPVEENRVEPTCTQTGSYDSVVYCSVCDAEISRTPQTINALGHSFTNYVSDGNATCTADGTKTATCDRCDATDTIADEGSALGHDYQSQVTAPTCTEQGYTTYTCSRCGDSYVTDTTSALGHSYGDWSVTTGATLTAGGVETKTCTRSGCTSSETRNISIFTFKLPNTDSYLYRVGNSNNVTLGTFFDNASGADIAGITVTTTKNSGNATCTYTANSEDWRNGTLKFANTGIMTVTFKHGSTTVKEFKLEVVSGTNFTSGNLGTLSNGRYYVNSNVVLLGDVDAQKNTTIQNKATVFGNGYTITDVRTDTSGGAGAYIIMNGGATIDNAVMMGKIYSNVVDSGQSEQEYAPGIYIGGNANIFNSYVREAKYAVEVEGTGVVNIENTTFDGGTLAGLAILGSADVTLKDCTTVTSTSGGKKGLAVLVMSNSARLHLVGKLDQYNMLPSGGTDLPSTYKSVVNGLYNESAASSYKYNNKLNMGVFFINAQSGINQTEAAAVLDLDDFDYKNDYGYISKTVSSITGTLYTSKTSKGADFDVTPPTYSPRTYGQHPQVPAATFNYTLAANYDEKSDANDKEYCYGETKGSTNKVYISFYQGDSKVFDPRILTVTKNGNSISPSSIMMNGTDYKNSTYTFTTAGDYEFVYTYTDSNNYDKDGNTYNVTYTKKLNVNVVTPEQSAVEYHPDFTYPSIGDTTSKSTVADNKTYIMPNVTSTSSTVGSTSVGGKTIYFPIVELDARNSSNSSAYSSGEIWYHAPAFKDINITDKNVSTGATLYTYNTSSTKWPHNVSASTKQTTTGEYYGYVSTIPWHSSSGDSGRSCGTVSNGNLGLCFKSGGFTSSRSACTQTVTFYYKGNDGVTYYYIIQYKFAAATYSSCVTEGTLVTMADGTKKAIEDVKQGDMVMTWSMWNGRYEAQPVTLAYNHGKKEYLVDTLNFSDGTKVRIINQHGFFDADKNTYAYIKPDNVEEYIGDRFVKQLPDGSNTEVVLESYSETTENVGCYSLQTAYNENFMVEDMLSMTGEDYEGRFEYFDIGEGMKYDEAKMQTDIDKYGLYTYEEWSDYLTPEQFDMFNGKYFKILVGKGVLTYEDIVDIIEINLYQ